MKDPFCFKMADILLKRKYLHNGWSDFDMRYLVIKLLLRPINIDGVDIQNGDCKWCVKLYHPVFVCEMDTGFIGTSESHLFDSLNTFEA